MGIITKVVGTVAFLKEKRQHNNNYKVSPLTLLILIVFCRRKALGRNLNYVSKRESVALLTAWNSYFKLGSIDWNSGPENGVLHERKFFQWLVPYLFCHHEKAWPKASVLPPRLNMHTMQSHWRDDEWEQSAVVSSNWIRSQWESYW